MYILGQPGGGRSEDNTYNFKIKYNFTDKQSMTYRYTHDKYKYFATDPVTFIHDADGKPMFSGSVLLPDGKYWILLRAILQIMMVAVILIVMHCSTKMMKITLTLI